MRLQTVTAFFPSFSVQGQSFPHNALPKSKQQTLHSVSTADQACTFNLYKCFIKEK